MQLSKYVYILPLNSCVIIFNTINSCIVELETKYLKELNVLTEMLSKEESQYLIENKFFIDEADALNEFTSIDELNSLNIIISLTENCNLQCKYCYQNNLNSTNLIELQTIDKIIEYIKKVIYKNTNIKKIFFDLIGGEPLLAIKQIEYLVQSMGIFDNIDIYYQLETNGTLFTSNIRSIFENKNLIAHITLSMKYDHNNMRPYKNGNGSFSIILENLLQAKEFFLNPSHILAIRYNVHNNNYNDFDDFVTYIRSILSYPFDIETAPIINYEYNSLYNSMSEKSYKIWNLRKHFQYTQDPFSEENFKLTPTKYKQCIGYEKYNIKIFSDGTLGMCNAWFEKNRKGHIDLLLSGIPKENIFPECQYTNKIDYSCISCKDLFLCGGKRFCKVNNQCNFIDVPIKEYLQMYLQMK